MSEECKSPSSFNFPNALSKLSACALAARFAHHTCERQLAAVIGRRTWHHVLDKPIARSVASGRLQDPSLATSNWLQPFGDALQMAYARVAQCPPACAGSGPLTAARPQSCAVGQASLFVAIFVQSIPLAFNQAPEVVVFRFLTNEHDTEF